MKQERAEEIALYLTKIVLETDPKLIATSASLQGSDVVKFVRDLTVGFAENLTDKTEPKGFNIKTIDN